MHREASPIQRNFLQFSLAGLDNTALAVPMSRVVAVTPQLSVTPVPLTPKSIIGLCKWSGQIITAIDLSVALDLDCQTNNRDDFPSTFLIVKAVDKNQVETIAWKISDAQIVYLPASLPLQGEIPLSSPIYTACRFNQIDLLLLDIDRLLLAEQGVRWNIYH